VPYIERHQLADLARLYRLLRHISGGLHYVLGIFEQHVRAEGLKKLASLDANNALSPETYFEAMVSLHDRFTAVIREACNMDTRFVEAMDKACRLVMNSKTGGKAMSQSPELLAKFCDSCLRKSSKHGSEADVEAKLSSLVRGGGVYTIVKAA